MFCMFGYHKWMVIDRLSLLYYMYCALGQTIVNLETSVLIGLMRQLIYSELPSGVVSYNYAQPEHLVDLFSADDMAFMQKHLDNLAAINDTCKAARQEVRVLEGKISATVYQFEKDKFRSQCNRILSNIEPQINQLAIATSYLSLQFCSTCFGKESSASRQGGIPANFPLDTFIYFYYACYR